MIECNQGILVNTYGVNLMGIYKTYNLDSLCRLSILFIEELKLCMEKSLKD